MPVSAIIPAYNESKTIGNVLRVVRATMPLIEDIIVISDGSTDDTAEIARNYGTTVIELKDNIGKSGAINAGLNICKSEVVLLLDADLIGLKISHIYDLVLPVVSNDYDMVIGIFKNGRAVTDLAQKIAPKLSGQRAIKKYILKGIPDMDMLRYGLEISLSKHVNDEIYKVKEVYLQDITHLTKEEKLGVVQGLSSRMKMYWDILKIMKR